MNPLVGQLPHLTEQELEQLDLAVQVRIQHLRAIAANTVAPQLLSDAQTALGINLSLLTAISETRISIARLTEQRDQLLASLTKATPGEDGLCMFCQKEVKSVPGGDGPVFVHADTQVVICAGQGY